MLKYEHIKAGANIRAYDFEPREGVDPKYIEGIVLRHDEMPDGSGAKALVIECAVDTCWPSENYQSHEYTREGLEVFVPMETTFDYDGRVKVIIGE